MLQCCAERDTISIILIFFTRRRHSRRSVDDILVDDYAHQRDRSLSPVDEEISLKRRKRLRSLSPPRRRRSVPFVPPPWKKFYKPMSDDEEVRLNYSFVLKNMHVVTQYTGLPLLLR